MNQLEHNMECFLYVTCRMSKIFDICYRRWGRFQIFPCRGREERV